MSKTILRESLYLTESELKQYLLPSPKAMPLLEWLDPERYPELSIFNLEDTYEFLPQMYKTLSDKMKKNACWRQVISQVVSQNEAVDQSLEKWLTAAKFTPEQRREGFYSVPFAPGLLDIKLEAAPQNTLWSCYVIPLLLTKQPTESIAIQDIYRRKLDYTELFSNKYNAMLTTLSPPPALIVRNAELENPDSKPFTLIEGAFRTARAEEDGLGHISCKIIPWRILKQHINIQPIHGGYQYQLPRLFPA